ncbi:unnamed protein product [Rotaria socialis]|uniref:Uncharacterized protein n=1 Tax=Rotaria socialis TaxID=392032 RepID=A0A821CHD7_9BILA|nr:unnamed protein product [Rotaria socialis]
MRKILVNLQTNGYKQYRCYKRRSPWCYAPVWNITYGENQATNTTLIGYNRFNSLLDTIKKANEYQIGSSYVCWCDTKNPSKVQWEQPNSRNGLIILIFGAFTIIPAILSFFLTYKFCKQIKRHQTR